MDTIKPFENTMIDLEHQLLKKYDACSNLIKDKNENIIATYYPKISAEQYLELLRLVSELYPLTFAFERSVEELCCNLLESLIKYDDIQGIAKMEIQRIFGCE